MYFFVTEKGILANMVTTKMFLYNTDRLGMRAPSREPNIFFVFDMLTVFMTMLVRKSGYLTISL